MDREAITAAFEALDAAVDTVAELKFDALTTPERLVLLERCERVRRRLPAVEHPLINQLARQATPEELGGKLSHAVAEWTLISRGEAARRIREAADLGERCGLTGEPLAPVLAGTAAAQRAGKLGAGQVAVIRRFYHQLPGWIDQPTRQSAEADLAKKGTQFRPEQLAGLAATLADCLNPDGIYRDEDRARRRAITLGNQQADGMSDLRGCITPELRATLEAVSPASGRYPQASWPHPACVTPTMTPPVWTAPPPNKPSTATPAAPPNAIMTPSMRGAKYRTASWKATSAGCTARHPPPPNRLQTPALATSCRRPVRTSQCPRRPED